MNIHFKIKLSLSFIPFGPICRPLTKAQHSKQNFRIQE